MENSENFESEILLDIIDLLENEEDYSEYDEEIVESDADNFFNLKNSVQSAIEQLESVDNETASEVKEFLNDALESEDEKTIRDAVNNAICMLDCEASKVA